MFVSWKCQIHVDFVRQQQQVVARTERGQGLNFRWFPNTASGIVRAAKQHSLFSASQLRLKRFKVHTKHAIVIKHQRRFDHNPPIAANFFGKLMVDRAENNNAVAGFRQGLQRQADSVADPMGGKYMGRIWTPAVAVLIPPSNPFTERVIIEIPVFAALQQVLHGRLQNRGGLKIHLRNPHRDHVR